MKQQQVKRKMAEYVKEGQDDQSLATMLSHFTSNSRKRQRLAEYYISKVGECIGAWCSSFEEFVPYPWRT